MHYGLQAEADQWEDHCAAFCERHQIPLTTIRVDAAPAAGESPEAAARHARYRAFESVVGPEDQLLTAHHQQDQAETFLLRALRGAGPRGLASMPAMRLVGTGRLLRPLLDIPKEMITEYAKLYQLNWVEDPSNQILDADRNFLRMEVIPLLQQRWPALSATLSRSSQHCAEADQLQRQWGEEALAGVEVGEPLPLIDGEQSLPLKLRVRSWLDLNRVDPPDTAQMEQIMQTLIAARVDATPLVVWQAQSGAEHRLRRFRNQLYLERPWGQHRFEQVEWDWQRPLPLTEYFQLQARVVLGEGLAIRMLSDAHLTVGWRVGGERCRPSAGASRRTLKNLLRESAVPPWERQQIPLIYHREALVQVVGVAVCDHYQAADGEQGLVIETMPTE